MHKINENNFISFNEQDSPFRNNSIRKNKQTLNNISVHVNNSNKVQKFNVKNFVSLGNLIKRIGEAITQNQNHENISNLINKIPNTKSPIKLPKK